MQLELCSSLIVSWIANGLYSLHPCYGITESCREVFRLNSQFSIKHAFRECIRVADCLANFSYEFSLGLHVLKTIPTNVKHVVISYSLAKMSS